MTLPKLSHGVTQTLKLRELIRLSAPPSPIRVIFVFSWRSFTISSPSEEIVMPDQRTYHSHVLDHLGLVAGMFDELGIGDVLDRATKQNPEMRDLTVGEAVKAMVLNGLGFINHALYLVPDSSRISPPPA